MTAADSGYARLRFLLEIVEQEGRHLLGTTGRLFSGTIDAAWVERLAANAGCAAARLIPPTALRWTGVRFPAVGLLNGRFYGMNGALL